MNTRKPYRFQDIDFNNIRYTQVKNTGTKTIVYIKYEEKNKLNNLVIQTPKLRHCNEVIKKNNVDNLDIELSGPDNDKIDLFMGFLNNLERKIISDSRNNGSWFDNFVNDGQIKYQKILRNDDNNNSIFRNKIIKRNDFQTILQYEGNLIKPSQIPSEEMWVKEILEIYAIWINENGFGLFIRPVLISFIPIKNPIYNYKLLDESSDDDEDDVINTEIESIFVKNEVVSNDNNTTSVMDLPENYIENLSATSHDTTSSEEPEKVSDNNTSE